MRGAVPLLLAGLLTGVAAVAVHPLWWGLLLAIAATLAALVAVGPGWASRVPFGGGFAATVGYVAPSRPEGDYVIAGDWQGYTLLGLAVVVVIVSVATLPRPRRRSGLDAGHP